MRLYQLINHTRKENDLPEMTWEPDTAAAAESVADEYRTNGMAYQDNAERLIQSMIPDATEVAMTNLLHAANAQDAVSQCQSDTTQESDSYALLSDDTYSQIGIGAAYDADNDLWSFFILMQP
jgi:uncharacterized protein YkwD